MTVLDIFFILKRSLLLDYVKNKLCVLDRSFHRVVTWQFSCSLVPELCHFRLSLKDGTVNAMLCKQADVFNRGPSALPLRTIDDEELTPFRSPAEIKQFLDRSQLTQAMYTSSQDLQIRHQAKMNNTTITDPFFCLRETIDGIWQVAFKDPTVCVRCLMTLA